MAPPVRLVLIHGFLATSRAWQAVGAELAGEIEVLTPDLPGHGAARGAGPLTLQSAVDRLAPLLDAPGPVAVAGHSMGAIVALALAREYPGRIPGLGLVSLPVFRTRRDALRYLDRRGAFHAFTLRHDRLAHAGCAALRATAPGWSRLPRWIVGGESPELVRSWFDHSAGAHNAGLTGIAFAGLVPSLGESVTVPVAATHSPRDVIAPFVRAEAMANAHGWRFTPSPGNHQLPITHPRRIAEWLRTDVLGRAAHA